VIGNHKQEAVKVAGCLSAITFKGQKEIQNLKPTGKSKKSPTDLRVPAPQPPEPMISIARKQRTISLREKSTFLCQLLSHSEKWGTFRASAHSSTGALHVLLWKKEMLIDYKRKKC
jgi:hypothetical protein